MSTGRRSRMKKKGKRTCPSTNRENDQKEKSVVSLSYSQVGCVMSCSSPLPLFPLATVVTLSWCAAFAIGPAPIIVNVVIVINACTSFQRHRSSIPFRRCVPRTHSLEAEVRAQEPEVVAASLASAQVPRAPTGFRGCARGVRVGCPRSAQRGEERLPVWCISECGLLQLSNVDKGTYVA
jgi:hypothetical protein